MIWKKSRSGQVRDSYQLSVTSYQYFSMNRIYAILLFLIFLLPCTVRTEENNKDKNLVPRTVIALYDSEESQFIRETALHKFAEMPLNHLGLSLEYHDIAHDDLPDIAGRHDVRGVITWFTPGARMHHPYEYLEWAGKVIDSGKKFVIVGNCGFTADKNGNPTSHEKMNNFLARLGFRDDGIWVSPTYDIEFTHKNPALIDYERKIDGFIPAFQAVSISDNSGLTVAHLSARKKGTESEKHLVITNPNGGYIAENYALYINYDRDEDFRQWHINPFEFFRIAFASDNLPKPDVTTIAGRRIYYSHIDGDGWNNVVQMEKYRGRRVLSSEVVMSDVIEPYPDLPITVTPIAADLDTGWAGSDESQRVAIKLLALPQVEVGSHTYSHPLDWDFFADGNIEKEVPYLHLYPFGGWTVREQAKKETEGTHLHHNYLTPRAFANEAFDIEKEITGSIRKIEEFIPAYKRVEIVTWSGNTTPFEKAVELTYDAGVKNINGGDSRFDPDYPSVAWVPPIGRKVGDARQIYASSSNENTYTDLWSGRYYGFKYLKHTVDNTESPLRLKPFNVYYHIYSAEKQASLSALLENLEYARTQDIAPVTASHYADIAEGFYKAEFIRLGVNKWRVENRGGLQTLRFDNAVDDDGKMLRSVDFSKSDGVVGQQYHNNSLYVYLDREVESPVVKINYMPDGGKPQAEYPYLVEGRWRVWDIRHDGNTFSFRASGFGDGNMVWQVPSAGKYKVKTRTGITENAEAAENTTLEVSASEDNLLSINLGKGAGLKPDGTGSHVMEIEITATSLPPPPIPHNSPKRKIVKVSSH